MYREWVKSTSNETLNEYSINVWQTTCISICICLKKEEQKLGNEKCASNRETHIYTMICCLLVDLSALFVHINIYTRVQRTRQHGVQIDEKNIETTRTLSLSLPLLLDSLPGFSHSSIFFLLLRLEATTSITTTTTITHTHKPLSVIIIINNNTSSERDERASEFLFRSQGKRGGNRLSWRCRRLFYYWAFYLFLSLLCVCVWRADTVSG